MNRIYYYYYYYYYKTCDIPNNKDSENKIRKYGMGENFASH